MDKKTRIIANQIALEIQQANAYEHFKFENDLATALGATNPKRIRLAKARAKITKKVQRVQKKIARTTKS